MKKVCLLVLCLVLSVSALCVFVACDDGSTDIEKYLPIEQDTYVIGDEYDESDAEIVAVLKNGTEKSITKNLIFVGVDELNLDDDGKFTTKGDYVITVYALEEREDLKIGEWTIKVA